MSLEEAVYNPTSLCAHSLSPLPVQCKCNQQVGWHLSGCVSSAASLLLVWLGWAGVPPPRQQSQHSRQQIAKVNRLNLVDNIPGCHQLE